MIHYLYMKQGPITTKATKTPRKGVHTMSAVKLSRDELTAQYPEQAKLYPIDWKNPLCFYAFTYNDGRVYILPREVKGHKVA